MRQGGFLRLEVWLSLYLGDLARRSIRITDARAGPLQSEDQSLGLSVPGVCLLQCLTGYYCGVWLCRWFWRCLMLILCGGIQCYCGDGDGLFEGAGKMLVGS